MPSTCRFLAVLFVVALSTLAADAFVSNVPATHLGVANSPNTRFSATALSERRWNFNYGQSPWGMKKNAEIWNGRVSQVRD